jgi:hypothetical protein
VASDDSTDVPGSLTAEQIVPVVAAFKGRMKRRCWQPALDARPQDAPTQARVTAKVDVEPSGKVATVTANGAPPAYPQLAGCVADVVRTMNFPRALRTTSVDIPFIFGTN